MKPYVLEVGLQILDWQEKDIQPTFSGLVKTLDGRITRNQISEALDYLYDLCVLKQCYEAVGTRWQRVLRLNTVGMDFMQKIMAQVTKDGLQKSN